MNERWLAQSDRWLKGMPSAWVGLFLGIALSWATGWMLHRQAVARQVARFEGDVGRLDAGLVRQLWAELDLLRGAQGFLEAGAVDLDQWEVFASRYHLRANYPGIRSLGFLQRVGPGEARAFVERMRREHGFTLELPPLEAEGGYFGRFVEPQLKDPARTLAINSFGEPRRREAIAKAIQSDELALTRPLELFGLDDGETREGSAVVAYLPVFHRGERPDGAVDGVVFTSLLVRQVFEPVLARYPHLRLTVRDESLAATDPPLFGKSDPPRQADERFRMRIRHRIGQRDWLFHFEEVRPNPTRRTFWAVLPFPLAGLALAGVFFLLMRLLIAGKQRAEQLAEDLRQSEVRFRRVAEQAPCGIVLLAEGVEYVNPFFLEHLGYRPAEVIGRPFADFLHPEDGRKARVLEQTLLRGPESSHQRAELRIRGKAGGFRWVDLTLGRLRFGTRWVVLATAFDVTERLEAEARRLEAERGLQEYRKLESLRVLAGGIAHDFNNLLGVVLGNADLVEGQGMPEANLQALRAACSRAADLTRQLLAYSGGGGLAKDVVCLNDCVNRALKGLNPPEPSPIDLSLDLALPALLADGTQVEQLVIILVENALEAIHEHPGARIALRTSLHRLEAEELAGFREGQGLPAGDYLSLVVEDQGAGMDEESLARSFDPFFTTKFLGRGLGLPALLGIVRSHGGGVRAESRPGRGSRFELILPVHEIAETALSGKAARPKAGTGAVLVVDDEPGIREVAGMALQSAGIPTYQAAGGRQALRQVADHRAEISLLVLDMAMPDLSGAEVIRALRVTDPGIRIILSSGYAEEDLRKALEPGDVAAFLPKPYRLKTLIDLVQGILKEVD